MERLNRNVGTANAALEERPEVLQSVGMDVSIDVLDGVVYNLMRVIGGQPFVGEQRVSVQCGSGFDVIANFGLKRFLPAVRDNDGPHFAATLNDAEYRSFVFSAGAGDSALALCDMHIARFAADESFVRFDMAAGLLDRTVMDRHADSVIQEPRRLLDGYEIAGDFPGANAVFAVHDQPKCSKPLVDTDER